MRLCRRALDARTSRAASACSRWQPTSPATRSRRSRSGSGCVAEGYLQVPSTCWRALRTTCRVARKLTASPREWGPTTSQMGGRSACEPGFFSVALGGAASSRCCSEPGAAPPPTGRSAAEVRARDARAHVVGDGTARTSAHVLSAAARSRVQPAPASTGRLGPAPAGGEGERRARRQARGEHAGRVPRSNPGRPGSTGRRTRARRSCEGQIADVAIYKNSAYLASWSRAVVPPRRVLLGRHLQPGGFRASSRSCRRFPDTYHGEGTHVVTFNGRGHPGGQQRAVAPCETAVVGGFDLYDVTNPANPVTLVQGAGDQSPDDAVRIGLGDTTQDPNDVPNSTHSVFLWQTTAASSTRSSSTTPSCTTSTSST